MTTSEVFRAAADHIRRFGHATDRAGDMGEPACLIGAVAFGSSEAPDDEIDRAWEILDARLDDRVIEWNKTATAEEAIAFLLDLAFDEDLKAAALDTTVPTTEQITQACPTLLKEAVPCA